MKNKYKSIQSRITTASLLILSFLFFSVQGTAQSETKVFQEWAKYKGTQYMYHHTKTITDSNKNAYIIGSSVNANGDYDIMVVKYSRQGVLLWDDIINGTANGDDIGTDLMLDTNDNLIVTGTVINTGTAHDLILRKYTASGSVTWTKYYNGSANLIDGGTALSLGANNDIYVGGATYTATTLSDFLMAKYNSSGTLQWTQTYDYVNLQEVVAKITYSNGALIATGISQFNSSKWEIATLKITSNNGNISGTYRTGGSAESIDEVTDIAIDNNDNIFIVGGVQNTGTGFDMKIVKLDEDLNILWTEEIDGDDHQNDMANAVQVDNAGKVYITGYVTTSTNGKNYYTVKLSANGTQLWHREYDGEEHGIDTGEDLVIDSSGNVYVTGGSYNISNMDYCTIKYSNNGTEQWVKHFNSEANNDDKAIDITLDDDGDIIVVGQVDYFNNKKRYYTVKYSEKEVITPPDEEVVPSSQYFIENKGQLKTNSGTDANSIKYYNTQSSPAMFVSNSNLHLQFYESTSDSTSNQHRVDLTFNKGNNNKKVYAMDELDTYTNFLGGAVPDGERERIQHQSRIYSPEVWTDIDMIYTSNNKGMKVYYVCKPGFNSNSLSIEFAGQDGLSMNGNDLIVETSINDLILEQGEAYQINGNGQRINMSWQPTYSINGNNVNIGIGSYNSSLPLIVELDKGVAGPSGVNQVESLMWSTYMGGLYNDKTSSVINKNEKIWVGGASTSIGFLTNTGATSELDAFDGFVTQFDETTAELIWTSRLFGSATDLVRAIDINPDNNHCYAVGYSSSTDLISSSTQGINDIVNDGWSAGFVIELDANGDQLPSSLRSYIDGDGKGEDCLAVKYELYNDGVYDPRLFIVGKADLGLFGGSMNFPIVSKEGAFNQTASTDSQEGFIMEINQSNEIEWCTYFGSSDYDIVSDIDVINDGIYIVGISSANSISTNCDVPTNGGLLLCGAASSQSSYIGGSGHYVAKFTNSRQLNWSTYCASGSTYDHPSISVVKNNGNELPPSVYVTGFTGNSGLMNTINNMQGNYFINNQSNSSGGYICRYSGNGYLNWKSYLSGINVKPNDIDAYGAVANNGLVSNEGFVIVGSVNMLSGTLPLSNDCQTPLVGEFSNCDAGGDNYNEDNGNTTNGNRMMIMSFDGDNNLTWSTVFGDDTDNQLVAVDYSSTRVIAVGKTNNPNTLEEFDTSSPIDYWRPNPDNEEGTIAMFEVDGGITVGINELVSQFIQNEYAIYPNPTADIIQFANEDLDLSSKMIVIYNVNGQIILKQKGGIQSNQINLSGLSSGVYLLQVLGDEGIAFSHKIIKQ